MVIAVLFHYMAVFFLPLIFLLRFEVRFVAIFTFFITVFLITMIHFELYTANIFPESIAVRVQQYLDNRPGYGFLVQIFIQSIITVFLYFCYLRLNKKIYEYRIINFVNDKTRLIRKISCAKTNNKIRILKNVVSLDKSSNNGKFELAFKILKLK
mgnify:CR=1 FL=1